jgi:AcrR family transcriptional regulator
VIAPKNTRTPQAPPAARTTYISCASSVPAGSAEPTSRRRQIAEVARVLLDAEGPEALTMRRIADVLGIRAPSLYKHVPDKAALEALVAALGFEEFAEVMAAAADAAEADEADGPAGKLPALADAYRLYAVTHPDLYRLMNGGRLRRDLLPEGAEDRAARPVLEAVGHDEPLARAVWAFAHGMAGLEIDGRLPDPAAVDAAWAAGIDSFRITAHEHTVQQ